MDPAVSDFRLHVEQSQGLWTSHRTYLDTLTGNATKLVTTFTITVQPPKQGEYNKPFEFSVGWDSLDLEGKKSSKGLRQFSLPLDGCELKSDRGYANGEPVVSALSLVAGNTFRLCSRYSARIFGRDVDYMVEEIRPLDLNTRSRMTRLYNSNGKGGTDLVVVGTYVESKNGES